MVEKLRLEGHCGISLTTFYRYLNSYSENGRVSEYSEGLQVESPSKVDDRMVDKLSVKVT